MYDLSHKEMALLRLVFQKQGAVLIAELSIKFGISIKDASRSYSKLEAIGFLRSSDNQIQLTKIGRNWIGENQLLFSYEGEKPWRRVPERFQKARMNVFEPYAPRRSLLCGITFKT